MGFSITSAVFGGIIIISYSFGIVSITTFDYGIYDYSYRHGNYYHYRTKVTILAIMFVLGLVTFGTGIWAATCTCLMKPCTACWGQPQVSSPSTFTSSLYSSWTKKWTCTNLLSANMWQRRWSALKRQPHAYPYSNFLKCPLRCSLAQAIFTASSVSGSVIDSGKCISR